METFVVIHLPGRKDSCDTPSLGGLTQLRAFHPRHKINIHTIKSNKRQVSDKRRRRLCFSDGRGLVRQLALQHREPLDLQQTQCLYNGEGLLASKLSSADLCPPACTDGWIGYRGKCYYFSETEGSWTYVQRLCSSFGASLAGIDSEQELMFLLRHKDIHEHWIGLWREQGQPWKWTNSTEFNDLFQIRGGGDCAYLNDEKGVSSSRCYMERRWICRQT
ncbi:C-type lectin domain family 2 member D-like [Gopherus flavomarginatus]|uniref:C-type lectin domain family 2 member D-like n=1 Tax=Gopherus flavomarginatus TaxID=286002 RepID=UPI0021CBED00|nr:C-type lectin domain family 2 member D-like [Gopherus flavomarginatus]